MNAYNQWTVLGGTALLLFIVSTSMAESSGHNKLIYILFDGFRYDYLDNIDPANIPGFTEFLQNGVRAKHMVPACPSLSGPNWRTLVTGLYPESHGIIGNTMYDDKEDVLFDLNNYPTASNPKWYKTEPIWTTATKSNRKTALIMWSGCELPFDGVLPEYCEPYSYDFGGDSFSRRLETGLDMLEDGYDFVQIYHGQPDSVGHDFGPDSEEIDQVIMEIDEGIVYMLRRLEHMEIGDQVNIVIVGDHGMTSVAPGDVQRIEMDDYILPHCTEFIVGAEVFAVVKVKDADGCLDEVFMKFNEMPGVDVYRRDDIPEEFHLKKGDYIYDLMLKTDINTFITASNSDLQVPREWSEVPKGMHGYDPEEERMWSVFFALGPDFRKNYQIPPIKNVDVYSMLVHLLQVPPKPNNGTWDTIKEALRDAY